MEARFEHGDDGYKYQKAIVADFSTNAWYHGPDPVLIESLQKALPLIGSYPELYAESLVEKLIAKHKLKEDSILVANGTTEAIFLIAQIFKGAKSRIISPTFSEYEHACEVFGHSISYCGAAFVDESMQTEFDLFWLCNPNNPTGQVFKKEILLSLIRNNPQTHFVIDEAYVDFCLEDISLEDYIGQFENLIILKSMTKNNCLPGLRLGYLMCHPHMGKRLRKFRSPWSVNSLAIHAGQLILDKARFEIDDLITFHSIARQLRSDLKNTGCEVFDSHTGYFLLKTPIESAKLKKWLIEQHGLLVRDASNFRSLSPYHIRIACLSPEKNELLVKAISECLAHHQQSSVC